MAKTDAFPGGNHARLKSGGKRQIILMQHEHPAAAGFLGLPEPTAPGRLRRNLVVSSRNLLAIKNQWVTIEEEIRAVSKLVVHCSGNRSILAVTNQCHPCSRMKRGVGTGRPQRPARARRPRGPHRAPRGGCGYWWRPMIKRQISTGRGVPHKNQSVEGIGSNSLAFWLFVRNFRKGFNLSKAGAGSATPAGPILW